MAEILETIMLICFGLSWPISVYKSIKSRTAKGKSPLFILLIMSGYIAGITAKIIIGGVNFVLAVYILNFIIVAADLGVYFYNKNLDRKKEKIYVPAKPITEENVPQEIPCNA